MKDKKLSKKQKVDAGKEAESSNKILEEEQNISKQAMSVYNNHYNIITIRTGIQSDIVKYDWEIDDFNIFHAISAHLISPAFPETAEYQIKIDFCLDPSKKTLQFYIITEKSFACSCSICIKDVISDANDTINTFVTYVEKDTFLCEHILIDVPKKCKLSFVLTIFRQIVSSSVINTSSFSTNLEIKNSSPICDRNSKFDGTEFIKFVINEKSHNVSKYSLCATNSSFFKDLCEKIVKNDLPNEVVVESSCSTDSYINMLKYIQTGFISPDVDYKKLLEIAYEYDVQQLKFICEQNLLRDVTEETALQYIKFALSYDAKYLTDYAASIIKLHYNTIIDSDEFQCLPQEDLDKINELIVKSKIFKLCEDFETCLDFSQ